MYWEYSFSVWIEEGHPRINRSVVQLLSVMNYRIVMKFTPAEFREFRDEISKFGLSLREIERVPFTLPETVL